MTQLETKIKRLKSSLPVDVDENEVTEVVDKVKSSLPVDVDENEVTEVMDKVVEATRRVSD